MTVDEVCQYFGNGTKAAKAIGCERAAFSYWVKKGYIPYSSQLKFEKVTKGKLVAEPNKEIVHNSNEIFLPNFRFYNPKLGMCKVLSLTFRDGRVPMIKYFHPKKPKSILSSFDTKYLCQGTLIKDMDGAYLYEKDIVLISSEKSSEPLKRIIENITDAYKMKDINFKIIGNSFEGVKNGYKESK